MFWSIEQYLSVIRTHKCSFLVNLCTSSKHMCGHCWLIENMCFVDTFKWLLQTDRNLVQYQYSGVVDWTYMYVSEVNI